MFHSRRSITRKFQPVIAYLVASALALAPTPSKDRCDVNDRDRCSAATQWETLSLYGIPPISSLTKAQVRRVFFVNGYARDIIALEFIRAAERSPVVRVHFPQDGGRKIGPLEAELTADQWEDVVSLSRDFEKSYVRPKKDNPDAIVLCIHPWVYWAEAIELDGQTRSKVGNACDDPPVELFAWPAAKLARSVLPQCNLIDRSLERNDATLLRTCAALTGDRITAARIFNTAKGFRFFDEEEGGNLDKISAYGFTLEQNGIKSEKKNARTVWDSFYTEKGTGFYYHSIHGLDAKTARVTGEIWRRGNLDMDDDDQVADVVMNWKEYGGTFEITSITIGAFQPVPKKAP